MMKGYKVLAEYGPDDRLPLLKYLMSIKLTGTGI